MSDDLTGFIREQLRDQATQWNLGTFGAIAEFMRDPGEDVALVDEPGRLAAFTARGGIGFGDLSRVRLFASETAVGQGWSHRVGLCLPETDCAMSRRAVLTELGPDRDALREEDRAGVLFDMGLGTLQADICIRTADPELIATLRAVVGRSLFEPGNPAMGAIVAAGPHRVFISRFGRCEVYQPIPPADGKSPEGPHTHVLPKLLAHGRTHAATEPVPKGFVPCAHVVPDHPLKDAMGRPKPWDAAAHAAFQAMLARFGDPGISAVKQALSDALAKGEPPERFSVPPDRFARLALRVGLRQAEAAEETGEMLRRWLVAFDRREEETDTADAYGHG